MPKIILPTRVLSSVKKLAQKEYPYECCGLLIGSHEQQNIHVIRHVWSKNVTQADRSKNFEIDPRVRLEVMRSLKSSPTLSIIGHYHSHPDRPAIPSPKDHLMAYEPELIWVIISVSVSSCKEVFAFKFSEVQQEFLLVPIQTY